MCARAEQQSPFAPAQAGAQGPSILMLQRLGPRFCGDERSVCPSRANAGPRRRTSSQLTQSARSRFSNRKYRAELALHLRGRGGDIANAIVAMRYDANRQRGCRRDHRGAYGTAVVVEPALIGARQATRQAVLRCNDMRPSNVRLPVHRMTMALAIMSESRFWLKSGVVRAAGALRGTKKVAAMAV